MARYLILAGLVMLILSCGSPRLLTLQGNSDLKQGKAGEAVNRYAEAVDNLKPGTAAELEKWLRFNMGTAYFLLGEAASAREQWDLAGSPSSEILRYYMDYNTGILMYQQGNYAGAEEKFRDSLRFNPEDMDAKINLELSIRNKNAASQKSGRAAVSPESGAMDDGRAENLLSRIRTLEIFKQGLPEETAASRNGKDW